MAGALLKFRYLQPSKSIFLYQNSSVLFLRTSLSTRSFEVGEKAEVSRVFSQEDVDEFAKLTGDFNPIHLDSEFAKHTKFGRCIVHGALVNGLISSLHGMTLPGSGCMVVSQQIKFPAPLYVGETVRAVVEVISYRHSVMVCSAKCTAVERNEKHSQHFTMSSGTFLLGFLLVCLVQLVFCCGASAGKESRTSQTNNTKGCGNLCQETSESPDFAAPSINTNKKSIPTNNQSTPDSTEYRRTNVTSLPEEKQQSTSTSSRKDTKKLSTTPTVKVVTTIKVKTHVTDHVTTAHAQTSASSSVMTTITQSILEQNFTTSPPKRNVDFCTAWEQCPIHHHPKIQAWLNSLPACPCRYPYGLYYNNTLYDKIQGKYYSWRNVNLKLEKLAIFKPTAAYCIRQLLPNSATSTATQQCCYDRRLRLITRGSGSGTPNLVAPELDEGMHNYVDLLPFISCQGDWTRYQAVRPPNNALKCRENPKREEFWRQFKRAREF